MTISELLKNIGLNKYETEAYLKIISFGVLEASEILKKTSIPSGKIYDTLITLENYSLIEVQLTRPKKYKAINPEIAYEKYLDNRKQKLDQNLDNLKNNLKNIKNTIMDDYNKNLIEKKFWKSAIEEEALDLLQISFAEVKKEILISINFLEPIKQFQSRLPVILSLVENLLKNNIKIFLIANINSKLPYKEYTDKLKKYSSLTIKYISKEIKNNYFIIDRKEVLFTIENPIIDNEILGIIKIENKEFITKLIKHNNELWLND